MTGDAAYDKKLCYRSVFHRNAKAVSPPQTNSAFQMNRSTRDPALTARDETIMRVGNGTNRKERLAEWKKANNYHRRSLAETAMSRLKHIFSDEMRARSFENQRTELIARCYALNIMTQMGLPNSQKIA